MTICLSSRDLANLDRAAELLISPLDFPSVDAWRSAVNRHLSQMLAADSAGFLLPVENGLIVYSDEHDPAQLARYPDYPPPPLIDGSSPWEAVVRSGVTTLAGLYGEGYPLYQNSAYYQDYAGANGAHDTLTAGIALPGAPAPSAAIMHFWHERPDGRQFGDREITLLRLLYPSFRAGVMAQARWGSQRADLLRALEGAGQAAALYDTSGSLLHLTPAMETALALDRQGDRLRVALRLAALAAARSATGEVGPEVGQDRVARDVNTATARYTVTATLHGRSTDGPTFVVAALTRLTPVPRRLGDLNEEYGLTPAEARVALLLGEGRSNAEIAEELFISPHTARRHTEQVLLKLDVRSRAQVAAKVLTAR
jgi:DNA-binding CsgD family transcriptional regulator